MRFVSRVPAAHEPSLGNQRRPWSPAFHVADLSPSRVKPASDREPARPGDPLAEDVATLSQPLIIGALLLVDVLNFAASGLLAYRSVVGPMALDWTLFLCRPGDRDPCRPHRVARALVLYHPRPRRFPPPEPQFFAGFCRRARDLERRMRPDRFGRTLYPAILEPALGAVGPGSRRFQPRRFRLRHGALDAPGPAGAAHGHCRRRRPGAGNRPQAGEKRQGRAENFGAVRRPRPVAPVGGVGRLQIAGGVRRPRGLLPRPSRSIC